MTAIETSSFRLPTGADDDGFLAADARIQSDIAYQQPGLVRRTTARGDNGDWLVLTLWESPESAGIGARVINAHLASLIDESSMRTALYVSLE